MYELGSIIKQSSGCEIFRSMGTGGSSGGKLSVLCKARLRYLFSDQPVGIGGGGVSEPPPGCRKSDRESLKLLRLAKQRIEADTKRLETCNKRIIELENEVASLRVRNHSFIYREGAISRDAASRGMMSSILPPPRPAAGDMMTAAGSSRSFSRTQNDDNLFSAGKGVLNVKLGTILESGVVDGGGSSAGTEHAEQPLSVRTGDKEASGGHSQQRSGSLQELHDLEEGSNAYHSHCSSTHRSHKSSLSNDHDRNRDHDHDHQYQRQHHQNDSRSSKTHSSSHSKR